MFIAPQEYLRGWPGHNWHLYHLHVVFLENNKQIFCYKYLMWFQDMEKAVEKISVKKSKSPQKCSESKIIKICQKGYARKLH